MKTANKEFINNYALWSYFRCCFIGLMQHSVLENHDTIEENGKIYFISN